MSLLSELISNPSQYLTGITIIKFKNLVRPKVDASNEMK